jgi:hypothetical protein
MWAGDLGIHFWEWDVATQSGPFARAISPVSLLRTGQSIELLPTAPSTSTACSQCDSSVWNRSREDVRFEGRPPTGKHCCLDCQGDFNRYHRFQRDSVAAVCVLKYKFVCWYSGSRF